MSRVCNVDGCNKPHAARGLCRTHWGHWRKTATDVKVQLQQLYPNPVERFWAQVDRRATDECWEFTGTRVPDGYGLITWDGRQQPASRVSWMIHHGPIPGGLVIRHRCDNPPCVNPAHLEIGTVADNARDMVERGRAKPSMVHGSRVGTSKLTEADVTALRARRADGESVRWIHHPEAA